MKQLHFTPSENWILIKKNWLIQLVPKFVFLCSAASLIMIALEWGNLPPLVPIWYSRPWGTDQLAPPLFLFILPTTSIAVYLINVLFSMYITAEYLIFTQALFLTSLLVSILSFIAVTKIIFLLI